MLLPRASVPSDADGDVEEVEDELLQLTDVPVDDKGPVDDFKAPAGFFDSKFDAHMDHMHRDLEQGGSVPGHLKAALAAEHEKAFDTETDDTLEHHRAHKVGSISEQTIHHNDMLPGFDILELDAPASTPAPTHAGKGKMVYDDTTGWHMQVPAGDKRQDRGATASADADDDRVDVGTTTTVNGVSKELPTPMATAHVPVKVSFRDVHGKLWVEEEVATTERGITSEEELYRQESLEAPNTQDAHAMLPLDTSARKPAKPAHASAHALGRDAWQAKEAARARVSTHKDDDDGIAGQDDTLVIEEVPKTVAKRPDTNHYITNAAAKKPDTNHYTTNAAAKRPGTNHYITNAAAKRPDTTESIAAEFLSELGARRDTAEHVSLLGARRDAPSLSVCKPMALEDVAEDALSTAEKQNHALIPQPRVLSLNAKGSSGHFVFANKTGLVVVIPAATDAQKTSFGAAAEAAGEGAAAAAAAAVESIAAELRAETTNAVQAMVDGLSRVDILLDEIVFVQEGVDDTSDKLYAEFDNYVTLQLQSAEGGEAGDAEGPHTTETPWAGPEGYSLEVSTKAVVIVAGHGRGLFYAVQSVLSYAFDSFNTAEEDGGWEEDGEWTQADTAGSKVRVPMLRIADSPRFKWRGLQVDSARNFLPVAQLMQTIEVRAASCACCLLCVLPLVHARCCRRHAPSRMHIT
jgi:hypothetical protein